MLYVGDSTHLHMFHTHFGRLPLRAFGTGTLVYASTSFREGDCWSKIKINREVRPLMKDTLT
jgi:hypothetical protein